ncbi:unannotated protein [freshwater metagenome]|uniref:Unannotated protein n=1 Tax=freshwater metagenome TaxID=449393 RepID=A0A6J7CMZ0_9ZZZZ|nr:hypothetical protein [Actinomycetota bacterium]
MNHRRLVLLALPVFLVSVAGCAKTTIDSSITEAPIVAVTTTLPTGSAAELLPRLVTEAGKLSDIIGSARNKTEQLEVITNLWNAARDQVAASNAETAATFDFAVDLCAKATQFNRPADADKCFRHLTALTAAYLG